MKKKILILKIILGLLAGLFLSNFPPFQTIFKFFFDQNLYHYSTKDGAAFFEENIFLGRVFKFKRVTVQEKRDRYPEADTIIYRNFKENPFAFWRYREYLYDKRYTLPYLPLEEADKQRTAWIKKMKAAGRPY